MPIIPLEELKKDKIIRTKLLGQDLSFNTTWGLFCPEEIDVGTKMLLECIEDIYPDSLERLEPKNILDIGCGYGPIGISLAKKFISSQVTMIDKDFVAIEYAQKNSISNKANNAKSLLSNGLSHMEDKERFDLIVSNLPAKVSKEFFWVLFGDTFNHLEENGIFLVVAIRQLEPMLKKSFDAVFGNHKILKQNNTYSVVMTRKNTQK